jgi:retron-type reverse transcriptase
MVSYPIFLILFDCVGRSNTCSIDDDILNLMDEVNIDEFLREASSVIDDPDKLAKYLRDKATIAIERFLVRNFSNFEVLLSFCSSWLRSNVSFWLIFRIIYRKCPFPLRNETSETDGCSHAMVPMVVV